MRRTLTLWILALVVTLGSAVYQRLTGPTYPVRGRVYLGGEEIALRLTRTHEGATDQPVTVAARDKEVTGAVVWRRYPTTDPANRLDMRRNGDALEAALPNQPAAGKLEYQVHLSRGDERVIFPPHAAVTRFKGVVSQAMLVPHIFAMFLGMLFSTRAGLEAVVRARKQRSLTFVTLALLTVGGMVLGPLVQKAAFGEYWTGVPWGFDLTDNKTLIAVAVWALAAWRVAKRGSAPVVVFLAAVVTAIVFAIPHSVWGSELRWQ